jgi:CBS domain-containing protein
MKESTYMMNIAFFLLPKQEVVCLSVHSTLRQTLERMEYHRYTAVPILREDGTYAGTVTEGDLLWFFKSREDLNFETAHQHSLEDVPLRIQHETVRIDSNMEDLIRLAKVQNFVPVVDDNDKFIGIVRRSEIIEYTASNMLKKAVSDV